MIRGIQSSASTSMTQCLGAQLPLLLQFYALREKMPASAGSTSAISRCNCIMDALVACANSGDLILPGAARRPCQLGHSPAVKGQLCLVTGRDPLGQRKEGVDLSHSRPREFRGVPEPAQAPDERGHLAVRAALDHPRVRGPVGVPRLKWATLESPPAGAGGARYPAPRGPVNPAPATPADHDRAPASGHEFS